MSGNYSEILYIRTYTVCSVYVFEKRLNVFWEHTAIYLQLCCKSILWIFLIKEDNDQLTCSCSRQFLCCHYRILGSLLLRRFPSGGWEQPLIAPTLPLQLLTAIIITTLLDLLSILTDWRLVQHIFFVNNSIKYGFELLESWIDSVEKLDGRFLWQCFKLIFSLWKLWLNWAHTSITSEPNRFLYNQNFT